MPAASIAEPDVYTCLQGGKDFEHGPHVDVLAAAILTFGDDGLLQVSNDYGLQDVMKGEAGRRLKFCVKCINKWKHNVHDYIDLR
jgi:hypothetical protein